MGILVTSPRPFPPPPPAVPWPGVAAMRWLVPDLVPEGDAPEAHALNLLDPQAHGLMLVQNGVRGLGMPKVQRWAATAPAVDGSRWRGHRVEEREVFWPLLVWSDAGTDAWLARDQRLWAGLRPDLVGLWQIATPSGWRTLRCRWTEADDQFTRDPMRSGWNVYGISLVAEQPYWEGATSTIQWSSGAGVPFLPGPPFTMSGSRSLNDATLDNPGDVPLWPVWRIHGPCSTARVGVAGAVIEVPFAVPAGQTLVIDTSPEAQTATMYPTGRYSGNGLDRTGLLGAAAFAPVPPAGRVVLSLAAAGGGSVECSVTPRYYRAW